MNSMAIQIQINKLESEIINLKAEIYDRERAIEHLQAVKAAMDDEEQAHEPISESKSDGESATAPV